MHKKLITACMAIAAFAAFVVAPAASAAVLTEGGVAVPAGASITGTAGVTKFTAGETTVECTHAVMNGNVTANGEGTIAGKIPKGAAIFKGTAKEEDCTSNLGAVKPTLISDLCLHVPKGTDKGTVDGCTVTTNGVPVTEPLTFRLDVTGITECNYATPSAAPALNVEITTTPVDAQVRVIPGQLIKRESNFFCPPEGELDMEFTLTTTSGATLLFS